MLTACSWASVIHSAYFEPVCSNAWYPLPGPRDGLQEIASWKDIFALGFITSTTAGTVVWNGCLTAGIIPGIFSIALGGLGQ